MVFKFFNLKCHLLFGKPNNILITNNWFLQFGWEYVFTIIFKYMLCCLNIKDFWFKPCPIEVLLRHQVLDNEVRVSISMSNLLSQYVNNNKSYIMARVCKICYRVNIRNVEWTEKLVNVWVKSPTGWYVQSSPKQCQRATSRYEFESSSVHSHW